MASKKKRDAASKVEGITQPSLYEAWERVTGCDVRSGDRIKTGTGWANADTVGAVGHPAAVYECVLRRKPIQD